MTDEILFNINDIFADIPIPNAELPSDFPFFTVTGESPYKEEFYITPHTSATHKNNYIFVLNNKGQVLKYKKIEHQAYDFKKVRNSRGDIRYTYLDVVSSSEPTVGGVQFYENSEMVVLDADFAEIDRIRCNQAGEIPEDYPAENHFSLYIDDGHYIIATYFRPEGSAKYENSVQEIKWNRVVFHWETNDSPELADLSHTTPTGDYAHINALSIDYDDNFIISFRNIGLVKLNKSTKEIMWVIGKNRNDFSNLTAENIPFQQHDIRIYKGDGSISVFDNWGHATKSRICRYYLNETSMQCEKYIEYITTQSRSQYMGSAQLIDDEKSIWDIAYGAGWNYGFEEYDFNANEQLMHLKFNEGYDLYNIIRDRDNLTSSFKGDSIKSLADKSALSAAINAAKALSEGMYIPESWATMQSALAAAEVVYDNYSATQSEVDIATQELNSAVSSLVTIEVPAPQYSLVNEVFDKDRYIDTGIVLFDEAKDFSLIIKSNKTGGTIPISEYRTMVHCMYEVSPWPGMTIQSFSQTASVDFNLASAKRFVYYHTAAELNTEDIYILCIRRAADGTTVCEHYDEAGVLQLAETINPTFVEKTELSTQTMIVGAADMVTKYDRYYQGIIHNFNYYDSYLSDAERAVIINGIV